ncbi:MAG TPA: MopE-related protein [Solirubrobacter sp.]|jgi:hypothetical protein|nr:MopE-related protein [Solirubrobacter sp.]
MRRALRCLAAALLAAAVLPAAAHGAVTVELDSQVPLLRIVGDGANDAVKIEQSGNRDIISAGNLSSLSVDCQQVVANAQFSCPRRPSLSVDLGDGDDSLTTVGVTDSISAFGGDGNDSLFGGADDDVLAGGNGNDTLEGLGGIDDYFGQAGTDTLLAVDGIAERLSCGADPDFVRNDPIDLIAECETGIDGDGDGFSSRIDCNDLNPAISPGAAEIPENGVDENCDGRDNANLDRDGDGFPVPADCNDADAGIRPGALEVKGNTVDENCDSRAEPFGLLRAIALTNFRVKGSATRVLRLELRNAPKGARVVLRCRGRGCPKQRTVRRTVPRDLAPVRFTKRFKRKRLRPGARLTMAVTATGFTGRTWSYKVKRGELPSSKITCRAPGERRSRAC